MATVQGIREKVHLPIYDSIFVKPEKQLGDVEPGSTMKFFVNVQGKTKLETNLQSASLLPHYNTFEARAMRVVISDLEPEYSEEALSKDDASKDFDVTDEDGNRISTNGGVEGPPAAAQIVTPEGPPDFEPLNAVTANLALDLKRLMKLLEEARASEDKTTTFVIDEKAKEKGVSLIANNRPFPENGQIPDSFLDAAPVIILSVKAIEAMIESLEKKAPPQEQIRPNDGVISKLVYNTVTTLFVGEKIMIEMPTWFFPSGAGPYSLGTGVISHGEPSPTATFRFAEPIFIDKQQNFRVEIAIPDTDVLKQIQQIYGPLFVWVVLDGYMTRDVQ